jgi:hypothetical protein
MTREKQMDVQEKIKEVCDGIKALLLEKNKKYGSSFSDPIRVFSKASPREQLLVRIDDKLSRIRTSGGSGLDEDTTSDLIGYLTLLKVLDKMDLEAAYTKGLIIQNNTERPAGCWKVHEVSSPDPMINTQTTVYPPSMTLTEVPQFRGFTSSTMSVSGTFDGSGYHGFNYERK